MGTVEWKRILVVVFLLSLIACTATSTSPIVSRDPPPSRKINLHEVQPGDTLYSIAWRYETDYREIARINGLSEPFPIHLRDKLKIYDDGSADTTAYQSAAVSQKKEARGVLAESPSNAQTAAVNIDASTRVEAGTSYNDGSRSSNDSETQPSKTKAEPSLAEKTSASSKKKSSEKSKSFQMPSVRSATLPGEIKVWRWPVTGKVINAFGKGKLTRGIAIDPGTEKQVGAAADGVVVYAGTGMRGFGNLLIVKHTPLLLSAYAYNADLLVEEGEVVSVGQPIANVGSELNGEPRVYFEIRRDGKPVDPVGYLTSH